jgi:hypothetical protein
VVAQALGELGDPVLQLLLVLLAELPERLLAELVAGLHRLVELAPATLDRLAGLHVDAVVAHAFLEAQAGGIAV